MIHASQSKSYSLQMRVEVTVHCLLTFAQIYCFFLPVLSLGRWGRNPPRTGGAIARKGQCHWGL